jgi:hypothetical protein
MFGYVYIHFNENYVYSTEMDEKAFNQERGMTNIQRVDHELYSSGKVCNLTFFYGQLSTNENSISHLLYSIFDSKRSARWTMVLLLLIPLQ